MKIYLICLLLLTNLVFAQTEKALPIIDMHMHALPANFTGPPPVGICAPFAHWHARDPKENGEDYYVNVITKNLYCNGKNFLSYMTESIKVMQKHNIYGVTSGTYEMVQKWKKTSPELIAIWSV